MAGPPINNSESARAQSKEILANDLDRQMRLFLFAKILIVLVYGLDVRRHSLVLDGREVGSLA